MPIACNTILHAHKNWLFLKILAMQTAITHLSGGRIADGTLTGGR